MVFINEWRLSSENYDDGEEFLVRKAEEVLDDPWELHMMYESLIMFYQKYLDYQPDAEDKLEMFCRLDIEYYFRVIETWCARYPKDRLPLDPLSFRTLTLFYESKRRFWDAADICYSAMYYEIRDYTVGGYEGRLHRFEQLIREQWKHI